MTDSDAEASDARLMQAWLTGSEGAFEILYRRWSRPVWRFLVTQVGAERADELHQETWLAVIRGRQ